MPEQTTDTVNDSWRETRYTKIRREGDILHCIFRDCPNVTLEIAQHCVQQRLAAAAGINYPCLIDMRDVKTATQEARAYFAKEGSVGITAGALLIGSQVTKMIANLFLLINRPAVPTRMFTNEMAARTWLRKF